MSLPPGDAISAISGGEFLPALINLGNLYRLAKDFKKAIEPYSRAVKLDPKNALARLSLAMTQFVLGSYALDKAGWDQAYTSFHRVSKRHGDGTHMRRAG